MSTDKHVTETICTGVALYGFKPDTEQLGKLYHLLVDWFTAHDCMPTELGIGAPGFSNDFVGFSRADKRLRKAGFENVDSFELRLLQTGELARSVCEVMIDRDSGSFTFVVLKSISRLDDTFLEELVRPGRLREAGLSAKIE